MIRITTDPLCRYVINRVTGMDPAKDFLVHLGGGIPKKSNFPLKKQFFLLFQKFWGCTPHSTPTPPTPWIHAW